MGLAASQCRLLVLTARKSDLEYRAQTITNRKLLLSSQTENIAREYTRKLSNRQMRFVFDFKSSDMQDLNENLTINSIYTNNSAMIGQYRVKLADGRIAVSDVSQLPYTLKKDDNGNIYAESKTTPQQLFANLSDTEKVSYLVTMAESLKTSDGNKNLDAYLTNIFGADTGKELSSYLNKKIDPESGAIVQRRRETFNQILDSIYTANNLKRTDANADFTKEMAAKLSSNDKNSLKEMFKGIYTALSEDNVANTDATATALATLKEKAGVFADSTKTPTDEDYEAAIEALNAYCNKDTDETKSSWLNIYTTDNSVGTEFKNAESAKTMLEYLSSLACTFKQGQAENTANTESTNYTTSVAALKKFMTNFPEIATALIMGNPEFQARYASSGAQVYTEAVKQADGSYTQQISLVDGEGNMYVVLPALNNAEFFQNALRTGTLILEKFSYDAGKGAGEWTTVNIGACDVIQDKLNTEDDAAAEAEYETQTAIIQAQDKLLDVELRQVETQQKACDNEYESVKKILDKNVERSFKVFS